MPNTVPDPDTVRDTVPTPLVSFPVRTPRELRAALANRNLSQLRLAALTGCDPRTVRRWVDTRAPFGDRQLPRPIQALIAVTLLEWDKLEKSNGQASQSGPQQAGDEPPAQ
jgi:hypothetical protein